MVIDSWHLLSLFIPTKGKHRMCGATMIGFEAPLSFQVFYASIVALFYWMLLPLFLFISPTSPISCCLLVRKYSFMQLSLCLFVSLWVLCTFLSLSLHFCHFSLCKSSVNYCLLPVFPHFPLHFGQCRSFAESKYHAQGAFVIFRKLPVHFFKPFSV